MTSDTSTVSFTAVDVETANPDLASVCQVGAVKFNNGQVVEEWQSYVNPEDYFYPGNIMVHGITEDTVKRAPTWAEVFPQLMDHLEPVVLSHTGFDRLAIARACERYQLQVPSVTWLDSARVARRAWTEKCGQRGYGLSDLSRFLEFSFAAHNAKEDAKAAGWVLLRAIADTGLSVPEWLVRVRQPIWSISRPGNPEGSLAGEVIVFTGSLSMLRREAAQLAATAGCDVQDSVTRQTTLLVVGNQDVRRLAGKEKSTKHRKAEALMLGGQQIRILSERDFVALVASAETG